MSELLHLMQSESYGEVQETLQFFLDECSLDEVPSHEEITQWRDALQQRGGKFSALAQQCQQYLDGIV